VAGSRCGTPLPVSAREQSRSAAGEAGDGPADRTLPGGGTPEV